MQITFFSCLTSIVWSSILIIAIYLCRKIRFLIFQFGVTSLVLLYLFCVIRMVLPLDFTFTRGFPSGGILNVIYGRIVIDKIGTSNISVLSVLVFLWLAVSLVLIVRFAHRYYMIMRKISTYAFRKDEQCKRVFLNVISDSKKQMKINVRYSRELNVPMGIGVFDKSIVLPDEIYSDKELYCILMHEYTHFLNRDLLVKMLIHIFCCIFWWNPIVYLLMKDLSQTLEIKCDLCVTEQMDNKGKADYLTTIITILKKANAAEKTLMLYSTTEFVSKDCESEIIERFKIVSEGNNVRSKNKILTAICILSFLSIFVFSYSFVVQPCYEAPKNEIETEPGTREMRSDNTYIIKDKDGCYTVVMPSGTRQSIDEKFVHEMEKQGIQVIEGK